MFADGLEGRGNTAVNINPENPTPREACGKDSSCVGQLRQGERRGKCCLFRRFPVDSQKKWAVWLERNMGRGARGVSQCRALWTTGSINAPCSFGFL